MLVVFLLNSPAVLTSMAPQGQGYELTSYSTANLLSVNPRQQFVLPRVYENAYSPSLQVDIVSITSHYLEPRFLLSTSYACSV
ncbi:hypothetical protein EDB81DRAFT_360700 [Dactylonectria macrodidyma]|uniref:Uncharacterized protein n=1 Tax=Dactylonectria macrodidyma TaxID=307937 RepID=A0A9P9I9M8_9HYPO|nr:hypothetical protein EDB81DRAFT_360700 [Dactylonectria macrodidyma]